MIAFADIKAEMRRTCAAVTAPGRAAAACQPAVVARGATPNALPGHIAPWMAAAFKALVHASETGDDFALVSCRMNGKPAAVIAYMKQDGERQDMVPLFLAVQEGMVFEPDE